LALLNSSAIKDTFINLYFYEIQANSWFHAEFILFQKKNVEKKNNQVIYFIHHINKESKRNVNKTSIP